MALDLGLAVDPITGHETTRSMVTRTGAPAGVDGGFSISTDPWVRVHGDPAGFLVIDGRIPSAPLEPRPSRAICSGPEAGSEGDPRVPEPRNRGRIESAAAASLRTGPALNTEPDPEDATVYTPEWGPSTLIAAGTVQVVVEDRRGVSAGPAGSSPVPDDGFVVAAAGRGWSGPPGDGPLAFLAPAPTSHGSWWPGGAPLPSRYPLAR